MSTRRAVAPLLAVALLAFTWLASKEVYGAGPTTTAPASTPTVVLLRLPTADEVTTEAMARVNGELQAAGFDVAVVPTRGDDVKRDLETAGRDLSAIAAFAIFVRPFEGGTSVAEIWVSDRIRQKVVIQDAVLHETDRGRGSEILAVRAVELLKANLADFWSASAATASTSAASTPDQAPPIQATTAPPARESPRPPRAPFASGLGAGLGAGIMEGFGALGANWTLDATVSYGWPSGLSVRASFAGLGPASTLSASNGEARVDQQLAMLEVVKSWWPRSVVVPFMTAGAGALHVRVVGIGNPPYAGHTSSDWALLTTVGAGVAIPLVSTLSIVLQGRGLVAWPSTVVNVAGQEVGRLGAPSLLADGGFFGTLP